MRNIGHVQRNGLSVDLLNGVPKSNHDYTKSVEMGLDKIFVSRSKHSSSSTRQSINTHVYSRSLRTAGNHMDESITNYVKRKYNLLIGERMAEQIKSRLGRHPLSTNQ